MSQTSSRMRAIRSSSAPAAGRSHSSQVRSSPAPASASGAYGRVNAKVPPSPVTDTGWTRSAPSGPGVRASARASGPRVVPWSRPVTESVPPGDTSRCPASAWAVRSQQRITRRPPAPGYGTRTVSGPGPGVRSTTARRSRRPGSTTRPVSVVTVQRPSAVTAEAGSSARRTPPDASVSGSRSSSPGPPPRRRSTRAPASPAAVPRTRKAIPPPASARQSARTGPAGVPAPVPASVDVLTRPPLRAPAPERRGGRPHPRRRAHAPALRPRTTPAARWRSAYTPS
ncbi:hypothetical protein ACFQ60_14110 [Streptomyces zhihengii]